MVAAVRATLPGKYKIAIDLGVGLGLRQGEVFGLSPDDIDWDGRFVHIRRQIKVLGSNRLVFGSPKNKQSRTVPLPDNLGAAHRCSTISRSTSRFPCRSLGGRSTASM